MGKWREKETEMTEGKKKRDDENHDDRKQCKRESEREKQDKREEECANARGKRNGGKGQRGGRKMRTKKDRTGEWEGEREREHYFSHVCVY